MLLVLRGRLELANWLVANQMASVALSALLKAGPNERTTAHELLDAVLDTAEGRAADVWKELDRHVDIIQV